jgi:hypothetical protein
MAAKKDLVIVILAIFCLALTLFTVLPTHSSAGAASEYDPWADINDDGKIDLKDIGYAARLFGAYGDPTKSVTTNRNWTEGSFNFSLPANGVTGNFTITTAGFKTITISLDACSLGSCEIQVFIGYLSGNDFVDKRVESAFARLGIHLLIVPEPQPWYYSVSKPIFTQSYGVTSPQMMFCIWNNSTAGYSADGRLYYYLSS